MWSTPKKTAILTQTFRALPPLPKGTMAPDLFNPKRSLDINTSPYSEIDALPGFIQNKMKSSKEYAARLRVDNDPVIGAGKVKNFRPKAVGEPVIEYPADGNPDDVPF